MNEERPAIYNIYSRHINDIARPGSVDSHFSLIPHFFYEFNKDPNLLVIYAGPVQGPDGLSFVYASSHFLRNFLLKNTNPDTKICFDNLFEGTIVFELDAIYKAIRGTKIREDQIHYFSCALNSEEILDRYLQNFSNVGKINVYSCNTWESNLIKGSGDFHKFDYTIKEKKKTFLCFNRVLREHRLALLGLLFSKDLVKEGYYSFFNDIYYSTDVKGKFKLLSGLLSDDTLFNIQDGYYNNEHLLPLKLNIESSENQNVIKNDDFEFFNESYFSLVTETFFFPHTRPDGVVDFNSIFFSEKIYKPILMKHPFILVSRPYSLRYLKKMGYKTFSPYIDESYDEIEDDEQRLLAIVNEVERLSKFSVDEWDQWQKNIVDIVRHNYEIIVNRPNHKYPFKRPNHETQY